MGRGEAGDVINRLRIIVVLAVVLVILLFIIGRGIANPLKHMLEGMGI